MWLDLVVCCNILVISINYNLIIQFFNSHNLVPVEINLDIHLILAHDAVTVDYKTLNLFIVKNSLTICSDYIGHSPIDSKHLSLINHLIIT